MADKDKMYRGVKKGTAIAAVLAAIGKVVLEALDPNKK